MTKREYFDLLLQLANEKRLPAADEIFSAKYRTRKGLKCVIGILIPEAQYRFEMEFKTVDRLFSEYPELLNIIPKGMTRMDLKEVQIQHDAMVADWSVERFTARLKRLHCFKEFS